jgi:hypothetical protein
VNQFDQIGHLLHFSLYNIFTGPCGNFSSGRDPRTGARGVPAEGGGTTTNILKADNCVAWLGQNQPGINEDLGLPKYDPSVCPKGTQPEAAAEELCGPAGAQASSGGRSARTGRGEGSSEPGQGQPQDGAAGGNQPAPEEGGSSPGGDGGDGPPSGPIPDDILDQILDLPPRALDNLPGDLGDRLGGANQEQNGGAGSAPPAPGGAGGATQDLLDFLFGS